MSEVETLGDLVKILVIWLALAVLFIVYIWKRMP